VTYKNYTISFITNKNIRAAYIKIGTLFAAEIRALK